MKLRVYVFALLAGMLLGAVVNAGAQGPTPGTIQQALRAFTSAPTQAFTGTVTAASFKTSTALVATGGGSGTPAFVASSTGGTGQPTTAAQNGWVKMTDSTGATIWVPVWK